MDTFGLIARVKTLVAPYASDDPQADVARVGSPDGFKSGELHQTSQGFAQDGVPGMANMEGVMRVRLSELDHDSIRTRSALAVVLAQLDGGVDDAGGITGGVIKGINVATLRGDLAEPLRRLNLLNDLAGNLNRPLLNRGLTAGSGFGRGSPECSGRADSPLSLEWYGGPLQFFPKRDP